MPPNDVAAGLTGAQKAAALMLALGDENCAQLFSMMHEDEIKEISSAMAQLGPVRSEVIERLCHDFADNLGGAGSLVGSFENTERLLLKTLPRDRVLQIMEEIRGPAGRTMWDKLGNVHEAVLANYLKNEYPQTVAVVLSKVRSDHAARVLAMLPEGFAMEVVMRMLRMESVQKDVLEGVERTLRAEFMSNLARSTRRDAHEMMAEIFNNLDRQVETRFVAALEERNRDAAERIKALRFTFDDLQRLTPM
ncbi:MAG: flagellar motor switch protein FliG, partial [Rhodospirillales bacterium]|nr:flagellar motor switch protein FliG [Rhodospirillales bacterium]